MVSKNQFCQSPGNIATKYELRDSPHGLMEALVTDHIAAMQVCCSQQEHLLNGMICLLYVSSPCPPALFKTNKQKTTTKHLKQSMITNQTKPNKNKQKTSQGTQK